jgi:HAD superfamily hydrolase (TIGR01450 family)
MGPGQAAGRGKGRNVGEAVQIPEITAEQLLGQYEALLLDAYGVLLHSTGPLPGASALVDRLNRSGKPYYLLTNDASRLPATWVARLQGFGLPIPQERLITSGSLLRGYFAGQGLAGARCAVLGPEDSRRYVEEAGGLVCSASEPFDVLVLADDSGFPFFETADAALTTLFCGVDAGRGVHLLLPNPDVIYPKGGTGFGFTSGGVAAMFEAALRGRYPDRGDLRFVPLGKPAPAIFAEAQRRSGTRNLVMVGDQLETDIAGARAFGIDAVWITTGVTTAVPERLRPTYRMRSLRLAGC